MGLMCPFDHGFSLAQKYPVMKLRLGSSKILKIYLKKKKKASFTYLDFLHEKMRVSFEFVLALHVEL